MKKRKHEGKTRRLPWALILLYLVGITSLVSGAVSAKYISTVGALNSSARVAEFATKMEALTLDYYEEDELKYTNRIPQGFDDGDCVKFLNGSGIFTQAREGYGPTIDSGTVLKNKIVPYSEKYEGDKTAEYFRFKITNQSEVFCKYKLFMQNVVDGQPEEDAAENITFCQDPGGQDSASYYTSLTYQTTLSLEPLAPRGSYTVLMRVEQDTSANVYEQMVQLNLEIAQVD